jgi:hypothetical protein
MKLIDELAYECNIEHFSTSGKGGIDYEILD